MSKILFLNACVRPESRTYILAQHVLDKMDGIIEEVKLEREQIMPLNWETLQKRDIYSQNHDFSAPMFRYAHQFVDADEIVIAAPYWDLTFPASIRIYFEAVTVCGLSFKYASDGTAQGLCKAKRIIYVTTAGGLISEYNLGYDYIKALCHIFYGIPEVICYKAENLDIKGANVKAIMENSIKEIGKR
ncbi:MULTISPECIES: NAD(P)H-dependent oxidoreductase [unclassified Clostridioides]|uniref:NAD(P)H-dependent oxidoreductase n=1 Tax=unclassified Clostridioides TaxID=2635829 RepID=UPI001D121F7C|nr:NAD(P)H-dependent oxidoreductase [Clostridioides sp. ZZV14-6154]MCC0669686.1 NAD(P)H-dependent oxidoreductase [Clostridioides sp. ZZV14-6153]MCC0718888.1 NAD(P)H-dependent oxidoreductase [Clostridioides sp. ZZV14-6105]MCC0723581.1 NAD(P)H-dependent oxidoreductase [Clostridioides sp. ZZV14-6104]MCC0726978.1 NAD(P)H-dependent oxidoreductase [Clostridioides sp. ZZV14-6045]MCC0731670.1 NAD(P)H-dependent oxidoreductase [Clostridioides sp. ZZV14-6048]MCC0735916.1 NAD(P)H-dependent oxidoreductase